MCAGCRCSAEADRYVRNAAVDRSRPPERGEDCRAVVAHTSRHARPPAARYSGTVAWQVVPCVEASGSGEAGPRSLAARRSSSRGPRRRDGCFGVAAALTAVVRCQRSSPSIPALAQCRAVGCRGSSAGSLGRRWMGRPPGVSRRPDFRREAWTRRKSQVPSPPRHSAY